MTTFKLGDRSSEMTSVVKGDIGWIFFPSVMWTEPPKWGKHQDQVASVFPFVAAFPGLAKREPPDAVLVYRFSLCPKASFRHLLPVCFRLGLQFANNIMTITFS